MGVIKRCSKCGEEKPLDSYYKNRNACKACECARAKVYKREHKESTAAYKTTYNAEHKEESAVSAKAYYDAHKGKAGNVEVPCVSAGCTETMWKYPIQVKKNKHGFMCKEHRGNHDHLRKGEYVLCACGCGEQIYVSPYLEGRNENRFFSFGCKGRWQKENLKGDGNPAWDGGRVATKEARAERAKEWRAKNLERLKEWRNTHYRANPEKMKKYRKTARPRIRKWKAHKYNTDLQYLLVSRSRGRIRAAFIGAGTKKYASTYALLGCYGKELQEHIQGQFDAGMSMENKREWHIDHIIPMAIYDMSIRSEAQKACNYRNLRPLWAADNILKHDTLDMDLVEQYGIEDLLPAVLDSKPFT